MSNWWRNRYLWNRVFLTVSVFSTSPLCDCQWSCSQFSTSLNPFNLCAVYVGDCRRDNHVITTMRQVYIPDSSTHQWLSSYMSSGMATIRARRTKRFLHIQHSSNRNKIGYLAHFLEFYSTPVQSSFHNGLKLCIQQNCGTWNRNKMGFWPINLNSMRKRSNDRFVAIWVQVLPCFPWLDRADRNMKDNRKFGEVSPSRHRVLLFSRKGENFRAQEFDYTLEAHSRTKTAMWPYF